VEDGISISDGQIKYTISSDIQTFKFFFFEKESSGGFWVNKKSFGGLYFDDLQLSQWKGFGIY